MRGPSAPLVVAADGTYVIKSLELEDSSHSLTVRVVDTAGNVTNDAGPGSPYDVREEIGAPLNAPLRSGKQCAAR